MCVMLVTGNMLPKVVLSVCDVGNREYVAKGCAQCV